MVDISYGTYPAQGLAAGRELQEEIKLAEQAGFSAIYFTEHHGVAGFPPSPLALAHFALGATTTLRSGPMPLLLPLHNPVRIAEESALIHHVSGGRLVLGVAAGWLQADFTQLDIPIEERGRRLDEGLDVVQRLWAGESQEFHGSFYDVYGSEALVFRPFAGRTPKLWIASTSKVGMRRAARLGAGLSLDSVQSFEGIARTIQDYRDICERMGKPRGPLSVIRRAWIGSDSEIDEFLRGYVQELNRYLSVVGGSPAPWVEGLRDETIGRDQAVQRVFVGNPRAVAEDLARWVRECAIDEVILKFQWGTRNFSKIRAQIERSAEVIRSVDELLATPVPDSERSTA